jgi:hypothetical protein
VLSRALAYAGGPAAFSNPASNPANIFDPSDFGPAPNDEKHRWVFTGIWQLPFGIQLAPISQLASARPYNPVQGINWRGSGSSNGTTRAVVKGTDPTNLTATAALSAAQILRPDEPCELRRQLQQQHPDLDVRDSGRIHRAQRGDRTEELRG